MFDGDKHDGDNSFGVKFALFHHPLWSPWFQPSFCKRFPFTTLIRVGNLSFLYDYRLPLSKSMSSTLLWGHREKDEVHCSHCYLYHLKLRLCHITCSKNYSMNERGKRLVIDPRFRSLFYHFLNVPLSSARVSTSIQQGWTTISIFQGIKGHTDQRGPNLTKRRRREPHSFIPAWISRVPDLTLFLNKNLQVTDHRVSNASWLPGLALPRS